LINLQLFWKINKKLKTFINNQHLSQSQQIYMINQIGNWMILNVNYWSN